MTYERSAVLDLSLRRPRVARQGLGTSVRRFRLRRDLGPIDQRLQQEVAPLLHRTESGRLIPNAVSQAKREAIALAFELDNPVPQADEFNLGFLVGLFRREKLSRMRPAYRRDTDRYLTFLEGFLGADFVVSRVGPREWEAIADAILQGTVDPFGRPTTEPRQAGVSTVGAVVKTLRRLGRFAVNYRRPDGGFLLTVDPTRGLAIPKVSDPARPVATDDRTAALLEVAATVHPYLPSLYRHRPRHGSSYRCHRPPTAVRLAAGCGHVRVHPLACRIGQARPDDDRAGHTSGARRNGQPRRRASRARRFPLPRSEVGRLRQGPAVQQMVEKGREARGPAAHTDGRLPRVSASVGDQTQRPEPPGRRRCRRMEGHAGPPSHLPAGGYGHSGGGGAQRPAASTSRGTRRFRIN